MNYLQSSDKTDYTQHGGFRHNLKNYGQQKYFVFEVVNCKKRSYKWCILEYDGDVHRCVLLVISYVAIV